MVSMGWHVGILACCPSSVDLLRKTRLDRPLGAKIPGSVLSITSAILS
jgi:hypothetical protein